MIFPKLNLYVLEPENTIPSILSEAILEAVNVLVFTDPAAFYTAFDKSQSSIAEIVILDESLAGDDFELVNRIKQRSANTDVVLISNQFNHNEVLGALRKEVVHVFQHPIPISDFNAFLSQQIDRIYIVGSKNFANHVARQHQNEAWNSQARAKYCGLIQDLVDHAEGHQTSEIAQIQLQHAESRHEEKATILTIDDEEDVRSGIYLNLKKHYQVLQAENGKEGLAKLAEHPDISVVILDVRMPGEWGNILLPKIKTIRPDVEVIMLTAYEETPIAIETFQKGSYEYLNKPFTRKQLLDTVKRALNVKNTREFGDQLPLAERVQLFHEFVDIKSCLNAKMLTSEFIAFFPEFGALPAIDEAADGSGWHYFQPLIRRCISELNLKVGDQIVVSRNAALESALAFTKVPNHANRAKMHESLKQLGDSLNSG